ncbi:AbrB/MazE/SpoVT family DNA-binding domain-containing protein [Allochromatium warmingii]|nr:AbrB/MazE/SpoVT family DNA-binding domain-containing protein [Allochromatium warmingii]
MILTALFLDVFMLAKRTRKNQITLPKTIVQSVGEADYYDIAVQEGKIVLTPVRLQRTEAVWAKLDALGITPDDVDEAIAWARKGA